MSTLDPSSDIRSLLSLLDSALTRWVCDGPCEDAESPPAPGSGSGADGPARIGWSPVQQLDHAALATTSVCGAVERILASDPRCLPPGPRSEALTGILAAEAIPRGRAEAPAAMHPSAGVTITDAVRHLRECHARVTALASRADAIAAASRRIPHFALGPMTASEWIAFARIHFEHHLAIAREGWATSPRAG